MKNTQTWGRDQIKAMFQVKLSDAHLSVMAGI